MKKLIILTLLLASCRFEGKEKTELGIVINQSYIPESHQTGNGITSSGKAVFTSSTEPEHWITVFKCSHGLIFPIDRKDVFEKIRVGDTVQILYRDVCRKSDSVTVDYNFLDANKVKHIDNKDDISWLPII